MTNKKEIPIITDQDVQIAFGYASERLPADSVPVSYRRELTVNDLHEDALKEFKSSYNGDPVRFGHEYLPEHIGIINHAYESIEARKGKCPDPAGRCPRLALENKY